VLARRIRANTSSARGKPFAVMIKAMTTWTQSERLSRESPN
jgi:hypothetical protein